MRIDDMTAADPTAEPTPTGRGQGDTLRLLFWQAPTILNPHLTVGQKDWGASRITYEPLASFDSDGQLIPFLAAEIPSLENGGVAEGAPALETGKGGAPSPPAG